MAENSRIADRIAMFVPSLAGGGAERVVTLLSNGLARHGYPVDLLVKTSAGPYLAQIDPAVQVMDLRAPRMVFTLPRLVQYLRAYQPQTLITALELPNLYGLLAKKIARVPTRVIISTHGLLSAQKATLLHPAVERRVLKMVYAWADAVVCVSQSTAEDMIAYLGVSRDQIKVIYNPVITPELAAQSWIPLDDDWFQPGQPPVVLSVGRLTAVKDYPTLLRAFALLRQQMAARLVILGEGEERGPLEALAREMGIHQDVRLAGFVNNPFAYMRRAGVFVLSSTFEGLSNVLIEAMACGCPVVSTACPGGPSEILNGGEYGHLTSVHDPQGLAAAVLAVLKGDRRTPPAAWLKQFESEAIIEQYCRLIHGK